MNNKKYQLLLTEDFLDTSLFPTSSFIGGYVNKPVLELASSDSNYSWQAHDIEFYTKIDGTHELSFSLEEKYFDEEQGQLIDNPLIQYLSNKCKIEVKRENLETSSGENGEPIYDTYFMVINSRDDKENKGSVSYTYSCSDAYIEELSKTGYDIAFSDDIETGNSLGTIHDFSKQVVEGSDWKYREDKTGTLIEYLTNVKWNEEQQRFDEVYTPIPSHTYKFIPEISQYAYQLETCAEVETIDGEQYYKPFYCAEILDQATTVPQKNLISNGDEFLDIIGWTSFQKEETSLGTGEYTIEPKKDGDNYYLNISGKNPSFLMNDTMTSNNTQLEAYQPYIFRYTTVNNKAIFNGIYISKNNLQLEGADINKADYILSAKFLPNNYYVIKPTKTIYHPYFALATQVDSTADLISVELFKVQGVNEKAQLQLISQLSNGQTLSESQEDLLLLPKAPITDISAYVDRKLKYFSRNNYRIQFSTNKDIHIDPYTDDELQYYTFEEVNNAKKKIDKVNGIKTIIDNKPLPILSVDELPSIGDTDKAYFLSTDNCYYQYYIAEKNGISNGEWGFARFGSGQIDKIRTLVINKSNRFNIIQELSELFRVWPVFNVYRNKDGSLVKEFWFKESALRDNFAGFHKGVNLADISRKLESNEIVTKMYVEDVEKSYITDGKISIAESARNPWGERYYYNFRYYLEQNLVGKEIEEDLSSLYTKVKFLNEKLKEINNEYYEYNSTYQKNKNLIDGYNYLISGCVERIAKLDETITSLEKRGADDKLPDKINAEENRTKAEAQQKKYTQEANSLLEQNEILIKKMDTLSVDSSQIMKEKKELIFQFENKYSQFIKEGTWVDSSYADNDTYYIDSQKVSNTSAIPKASWTINIIDGLATKELKDFTFKVGDKTFLIDNGFFKPVEDGKDYKFEILITGYRDCFDNTKKNQIEVRNYLTTFEDLFQRVSAATQTLELKEQTYDKAARFTADGQIESDILQKSFLNNDFILSSTDDNSYELGIEGLKLQSIPNPSKKVRITSEGVFLSNKKDKKTGASLWETGITADGINASIITAGEIDTSLIKIFSKGQELFSWNELGITAYHEGKEDTSKNFTRFDQFGVYVIEDKDGFNYNQNGEVWWRNHENPLKAIKDNATVSLTKDGFRLNVQGKGGNLVLGYLKEDKSIYGFEIKRPSADDPKELETYIRFPNTGTINIAGFNVSPSWIYSDLIGLRGKFPDDSSYDDRPSLYIGYNYINEDRSLIPAWDDVKGKMPFYITKNGQLHARTAYIGGEWVKSDSDNKFYQIQMLPFINSEGYYENTRILSSIIKDNESSSANILLSLTAGGEIRCKRLFIDGQEVHPGGGGGTGTGTLAYPCPTYTGIGPGWSPEHGGVDFNTYHMINNDVIASESGLVVISEDLHTGTIGEEPHGYKETAVIDYNNATPTSEVYGSYGRYIVIRLDKKINNKYAFILCAHLNYRSVEQNQRVSRGQLIGLSGTTGNSTGPHVHFELRLSNTDNFSSAIQVDPTSYFTDGGYEPTGANNKEKIYNYLTQNKGYSKSMAIGIMANIQAESNFDPASYTPQDVDDEGGGLCGWWGPNFRDMIKEAPHWKTSISEQLDFLHYDITDRSADVCYDRLHRPDPDHTNYGMNVPGTISFYNYIVNLGQNNTKSAAQDIAKAFCICFEFPQERIDNVTYRQNNASALWDEFSS